MSGAKRHRKRPRGEVGPAVSSGTSRLETAVQNETAARKLLNNGRSLAPIKGAGLFCHTGDDAVLAPSGGAGIRIFRKDRCVKTGLCDFQTFRT